MIFYNALLIAPVVKTFASSSTLSVHDKMACNKVRHRLYHKRASAKQLATKELLQKKLTQKQLVITGLDTRKLYSFKTVKLKLNTFSC